jgi:Arc/MetJ-type ribon-helix-helix transcriptional regulator
MSTISVPLTPELESALNRLVKSGVAETKAGVMRRALKKMSDEEAINDILEAQQEAREGKLIRGDIRKIIAKMSVA